MKISNRLKLIKLCLIFYITLSWQLSTANPIYGIRNNSRQFEFVKIDLLIDSIYILNQLPNFYYTQNFSSSFNYIQQKFYLCFGQQLQVLDCILGLLHESTIQFGFMSTICFSSIKEGIHSSIGSISLD